MVPGRTDHCEVSPVAPLHIDDIKLAPELEADILRSTNITKTQCAVQPDGGRICWIASHCHHLMKAECRCCISEGSQHLSADTLAEIILIQIDAVLNGLVILCLWLIVAGIGIANNHTNISFGDQYGILFFKELHHPAFHFVHG